MSRRWREFVLQWLRVPPEPHPPAGAPASLRVFRAGKNFLTLRLWTWGLAQAAALAGIVFWTVVLVEIERAAAAKRATKAANPAAPPTTSGETAPAAKTEPKAVRNRAPREPLSPARTWELAKRGLVEAALRLPPWAFPLLWFAKIAGIALYLVQIPFTYAVRRLDYELRWYAVTDRSLRIRAGIVAVQESTLSFANLQQVVISQGPLQRLLGLADVRVQSAGGGGGDSHASRGPGDSLHTAVFHAVDNAPEIRDLILDRLRRFRETGLGDPDEPAPAARFAPASASAGALLAARELLAEARALRRAL